MVILSVGMFVCLSVTTRYCFKTRWDRDFGFSPYDSSMSSILGQNFIPLGKGVCQNEGEKSGLTQVWPVDLV